MINFYVDIMRDGEEEPVKRMGPMPRGKAERVEDGANINLNHEKYYTQLVEAKDE